MEFYKYDEDFFEKFRGSGHWTRLICSKRSVSFWFEDWAKVK